jgi:TonB family protein
VRKRLSRLAWAVAAVVMMLEAPLRASDPLATARDRYAAAAYEEALAMLDALPPDLPAIDRDSVALYRTLCLFALGRTDDARRAIDAIMMANPLYEVSGEEVPPRLLAAFVDARRRILPAVLQQMYADGKAAFDRKDYAPAAATFARVISGLGHADITTAATQPPLSDLKTLVSGFHALSVAAATPPPAPAPVVVPEPRRPVIYSSENPNVVPPNVIRQELPAYRGIRLAGPKTGIVEVLVDETGSVESVIMRVPAEPAYDRQVLAAAKQWQYVPAQLDGKPVKYLRRVQVTLVTTTAR